MAVLKMVNRLSVLGATLSAAALLLAQLTRGQSGTLEAEAERPVAVVTLDGKALFRVRGVDAYPAEQRARAIGDREAVAADRSVSTELLESELPPSTSELLSGVRSAKDNFPSDRTSHTDHVVDDSLLRVTGLTWHLVLRGGQKQDDGLEAPVPVRSH